MEVIQLGTNAILLITRHAALNTYLMWQQNPIKPYMDFNTITHAWNATP